MRTSQLLYLATLFSFRSSSCFHTDHLEKVDVRMLRAILRYSFDGHNCIALHKDTDELENAYYETIFQTGLPLLLQGYQKYCKGYIIFTKDVYGLESIMKGLRKYYSDRFVCYIYESKNWTNFIEDHSEIFGEAEILVSSSSEAYQLNTITKTFIPILMNNCSTSWGKYKAIYNFMGREFNVGAFRVPIFVSYGMIDTNGRPDWIKGVELTAFDMIASFINVSWRIVKPPATEHPWGRKTPNGSWTGGIFKMLDTGRVDVAMGCIFMTIEKYESFSLSNVMDIVRLRHLIKRPRLFAPNWSSIFRPLPLPVWIILLLEIFLHTFSIAFVTRLKKKILKEFIYKEYSGFWKSSILSLGILFMTGIPPSKKEQGPLRYLMNSWVVTCFLVTTCFGSSLVSHLTTPDLEFRPETIKELVQGGYYWAMYYKPNTTLFFNADNPWHQAWSNRFLTLKDKEHHLKLIDSDKFVLWGKSIDRLGYILNEEYLEDEKLSQWEISNEIITNFYFNFAVAPTSPLIIPLNRYILLLVQTGHMSKLIKDEFMAERKTYMSKALVKTKPTSVASILVINNFQGLFYLYFAGLTLGFVSFIYEIYCFKKVEIIHLKKNCESN